MQIRNAIYSNKDDAIAIISLMQHYASDPMGGGEALSNYTVENLVSALSKIPGAFTLLGFIDDEAVGLINCFEGFSTFKCKPLINIHDVIVRRKYRGKGIAGLMLKKVEEIAIERGCCKLTLEVLEGNQPAKEAYAKEGFVNYSLDPETGNAMFWEKIL
jgi:GNAT superfamily N-acetyltransferase